jgi:hypothetical protein
MGYQGCLLERPHPFVLRASEGPNLQIRNPRVQASRLRSLLVELTVRRIISTRCEWYRPLADRQTPFAARRRRSARPASSMLVTSLRTRSTALPSFIASSQDFSSSSVHSVEMSPVMMRRVRCSPSSLSSRNIKQPVHRAFQALQYRFSSNAWSCCRETSADDEASAEFRQA